MNNNEEMAEKILNKKFKKSIFSGYDTVDVDTFFDLVIEYLKSNNKMIKLYKEESDKQKIEIEKLNTKVSDLTKENQKLSDLVKELREEGYGNRLARERLKK